MIEYETKRQKKFRRRKVLSVGILIGIPEIVWTGKWFKRVEIIEEKYLTRYKEFDEWNYTFFWGKWKESWEFVKLA